MAEGTGIRMKPTMLIAGPVAPLERVGVATDVETISQVHLRATNDHGERKGSKHRRWTAEDDLAVRQLAGEGNTMRYAAQRIGSSFNSLKNRALRLGIRFNPHDRRPRRVDWKEAERLAAAGIYLAEASRHLGIHHTTALNISRIMGFTWPKAQSVCRRKAEVERRRVRTGPEPSSESSRRIERMLQLSSRL